MVRILAIKWITFALTLASPPVPKAGSYEAGERFTIRHVSYCLYLFFILQPCPSPKSCAVIRFEKLTQSGIGRRASGRSLGGNVLRARKRSSERMATALIRSTVM